MKGKTNIHHNIPISISWEDVAENKIILDTQVHEQIHKEQNIPKHKIREYRMRINGILVPDDTFFQLRNDIWKQYFENPCTESDKQKGSLIKQINRYYRLIESTCRQSHNGSYNDIIDELIDIQKSYIQIKIKKLL